MRTENNWQPIATAPRDGTDILYISKNYGFIGLGNYRNGRIWTGGVIEKPSATLREWDDVATCWMPLPQKPDAAPVTPAPSTHFRGTDE